MPISAPLQSSHFFIQGLKEAQQLLEKLLRDSQFQGQFLGAVELLTQCLEQGGKILTCGNGGSHCDAMHFSEELTGRYYKDRRPLAAISLSEPAHLSCVANDFGYEFVFERYVQALMKPQDVLLAISTSGQSKNINLAAAAARKLGGKVLALSGKGGGELKGLADIALIVDHTQRTDRIQEIHIKLIHLMIEGIERQLFPEHYL